MTAEESPTTRAARFRDIANRLLAWVIERICHADPASSQPCPDIPETFSLSQSDLAELALLQMLTDPVVADEIISMVRGFGLVESALADQGIHT